MDTEHKKETYGLSESAFEAIFGHPTVKDKSRKSHARTKQKLVEQFTATIDVTTDGKGLHLLTLRHNQSERPLIRIACDYPGDVLLASRTLFMAYGSLMKHKSTGQVYKGTVYGAKEMPSLKA